MINNECGRGGWDSGFGGGATQEDVDVAEVLMLLLEKDLSQREMEKVLVRVWKMYPMVRNLPPGWEGKSSQ